jgi:CNT family concentrative nucleoside transporter
MELGALRGVIGIFALLAVAVFFSKDRSAIIGEP